MIKVVLGAAVSRLTDLLYIIFIFVYLCVFFTPQIHRSSQSSLPVSVPTHGTTTCGHTVTPQPYNIPFTKSSLPLMGTPGLFAASGISECFTCFVSWWFVVSCFSVCFFFFLSFFFLFIFHVLSNCLFLIYQLFLSSIPHSTDWYHSLSFLPFFPPFSFLSFC